MKREDKTIEFLNDTLIGEFGDKTELVHLLQNLVYAQERVAEEDFFRFKLFVKAAREGREASVIFRARDEAGTFHHWLQMHGVPGSEDPSLYYGVIRNITQDVSFVNHLLEKDLERQIMIQHDTIPTLLVDMKTKAIISRNTFAYGLFGYEYHEFNEMGFRDIYPESETSRVSRIYETCLLEGFWEGHLVFLKKDQVRFGARIKIKRISLRERNLLRISIYESIEMEAPESPAAEVEFSDREQFKKRLMIAVSEKHEIEEILDTLLAHPYETPRFEAVLYADVYPNKQKIDIYGRGAPFTSLKPGISFNYNGTVSQAIVEKHLSFVILSDTLESTIPSDWALFIPHGIRSYFAKPFFHGSKLRTLLMFCSTEVNRFSEKDMGIYELYYQAFQKGLRNWRSKKKQRPGS
ncbi:MAG: hypothetical protein ACM3SY_14615 [Candidatus Omnitrophota bacterium]